MRNLVAANTPLRKKHIQFFMQARGIEDYVYVETASQIFNELLLQTCNIWIFDDFLDITYLNTLQDYKGSINNLTVFVPDVTKGRAWLALTDQVFILPDETTWLSYFWDQPVCHITNANKCEAGDKPVFLLSKPKKPLNARELKLRIKSRPIHVKYMTNLGEVRSDSVQQLYAAIQIKGKPFIAPDARNQVDIYGDSHIPLELVHAITSEKDISEVPEVLTAKKEKRARAPKPSRVKKSGNPHTFEVKVESSAETIQQDMPAKQKKLRQSLFNRKKEVALDVSNPEVEVVTKADTQENVIESVESVVSDKLGEAISEESSNVVEKIEQVEAKPSVDMSEHPKPAITLDEALLQGKEKAAATATQRIRFKANSFKTYTSVEAYLLEEHCISQEAFDETQTELKKLLAQNKQETFVDLAIKRGGLDPEKAVEALTRVRSMEVLDWSQIQNFRLNYTEFTFTKYKELSFFQVEDDADGSAQIIMSISSRQMDASIRRLFDRPRIRYTLQCYIERRLELEEVEQEEAYWIHELASNELIPEVI